MLPARLFKQYATTSNLPPHFPSAEWTCYVSAVCPTPLTKALLSVDRQDDLEHSQTSSTSIQKWLYDTLPFFHQGSRSVLSLKGLTPSRSPPSQLFISALEYRSILTDPVLHGVFHPSLTSLHITHHCSSRRLPETKILTTEEDSQDEIEINESFLGGLTFLPAPPTQSVQLVRDGCLNQCDNWGCTYPLLPLYSPMCSQHEDPIVCVRTKDLSRIGILNGEWVRDHILFIELLDFIRPQIVLQLPRSKSRRLMRVIVDDSLDDSP